MEIYLILFLLLIGLIVGLIIWIVRLLHLYRKGKKKSFAIQVSILTVLLILLTWELQIFPLSKNLYIQDRTTELTGKKFWSWEEFDYKEISVRQDFIRQIANHPGSYYSYDDGGSTNFYLIVPDKRLVILINHNM